MNENKTSFDVYGVGPARLCAPANQGGDVERFARISSLKPQIAVVLAAIIAATSFGVAAKQLLTFNHAPWMLLTLGGGHALVALAGLAMWKRVESGAGHYIVSDFLKSEKISFEDVCMVVEGHGMIWKSIRIHFRRPTRFGWSVSYVPVLPSGRSATASANQETFPDKSNFR